MLGKLRITFLLPCSGQVPVGGVKVVYEYANRLADRGHEVEIVHAASRYTDATFKDNMRSVARYLFRSITRSYRPDSWFKMNHQVKLKWVPSLAEQWISDGDIVIATAWQTAEWAVRYSSQKGRGYYLIQHLELWDGMEDRVYATWKSSLRKVVISRWLQKIARDLGQESTYIPNGLDFEVFKVTTPIAERDCGSIAMLYHEYPWKGSSDGIAAISLVRAINPNLRVTLFGVPPRPDNLPEWIDYECCATQTSLQRIYNRAAIFVAPSWSEGWGLPATEAMMCGSALAATDIGGHREFAIHEKTALLSPPKDPKSLAENITRLIHDSDLRTRIANNGNLYVQQFTWQRSVDEMEATLLSPKDVMTK